MESNSLIDIKFSDSFWNCKNCVRSSMNKLVNKYIVKQLLARIAVLGTTGNTSCPLLFTKVVHFLIGEMIFNVK